MSHTPHFAFVAASAPAFSRNYAAVVRALLANGTQVSLASPPDDGALDELTLAGLQHAEVPLASGEGPGGAWRDGLTAPTLVARWDGQTPDVVHATSLRALPATMVAAGVARVPFRIATLDLPPEEVGESLVPAPRRLPSAARTRLSALRVRAGTALVTRLAQRADRLIALHRGLEGAWSSLGGDRIVRLDSGYGVAIDSWISEDDRATVQTAARQRLGWQRERFVWTTVPLACDPEVIERLAAISQVVARELPSVRIGVVPSGEHHEARLRAALRGPVFVHCSARERMDAIVAGDALLQAESRGSFARPVMEAALARVPAVVSAIDMHRAAVRSGKNGMLVAGDDPRAWVAAVRGLVQDATTREEAGARARSYAVRLFDADLIATKILDVYDEAFRAKVGEPLHLSADGVLGTTSDLLRRGTPRS